MFVSQEYSAGLMSQSFWFHEFKTVLKLRTQGLSYDEIKRKCIEDNLFGAAKEYRALRMAGYVVNRLRTVDNKTIELFESSDLATRKLINLIAIIRTDYLFFEFLYEVYREKIIIGDYYLDDSDVNVFFTKKEAQSELVAGWKDSTKKHLRSNYLNYLEDAGLIITEKKTRKITPPILDIALERYLKSIDEEVIVKALTGADN